MSDNLTREQRSYMMSRVRSKDTTPELLIRHRAHCRGLRAETVRRLFMNEPGVIVLGFPRKGKRVYRTLRVPERVYERVLNRMMKVA